ncbi:fimbrial protein [Dyella amyloliquefaciens]|uniref:fimbrial protein n=1 Tax=Dyella amyloliquefaciens TaxID=1770545 RepID=UPI00102E4485|nr:type 1 fimbrial protein [Dyella amyloliquefaciens]
MNKFASAALTVALLSAVSSAYAQTSTVLFNITGTIQAGTCALTVADVDLGTYPATAFTGAYTTSWKDVPVQSSACDPLVTTVHIKLSGGADLNNSNLFTGVSGIGIELQRTSDATPILPAGTSVDFVASTAATTYHYQARFHQSAATVAAGTAHTPVTLNATYN